MLARPTKPLGGSLVNLSLGVFRCGDQFAHRYVGVFWDLVCARVLPHEDTCTERGRAPPSPLPRSPR